MPAAIAAPPQAKQAAAAASSAGAGAAVGAAAGGVVSPELQKEAAQLRGQLAASRELLEREVARSKDLSRRLEAAQARLPPAAVRHRRPPAAARQLPPPLAAV